MTPIEILLILISAGIIISSCFLVEKPKDKNNSVSILNQNATELSFDEIKSIKNTIDDIVIEKAEESVLITEKQLSKITNEKMIAVNDFSNMVLDKINKNHEEVVFLYNMLNEKESEVKELIAQVERSKISPYETREGSSSFINDDSNTTNYIYEEQNRTNNEIITNGLENNNEQILALHKQGKSILEISKILEVGQGEVKLVIDLFK